MILPFAGLGDVGDCSALFPTQHLQNDRFFRVGVFLGADFVLPEVVFFAPLFAFADFFVLVLDFVDVPVFDAAFLVDFDLVFRLAGVVSIGPLDLAGQLLYIDPQLRLVEPFIGSPRPLGPLFHPLDRLNRVP